MRQIRVVGYLEGLKNSVIQELDNIFDIESNQSEFIPKEIVGIMVRFSNIINREIAVYLDRKNKILQVAVGESNKVELPELEGRWAVKKLSGVRCIHTHPSGNGELSIVDINSMLNLNLDSVISMGALDKQITNIYVATPNFEKEAEKFDIYGPFQLEDDALDRFFEHIIDVEKSISDTVYTNYDEEEKAILVGIDNGNSDGGQVSLEELEELAKTAGAQVVHRILQRKSTPDPALYIGRGKVEEIAMLVQTHNSNLVIFDVELTGAQVRNIEELVGTKVIDRTTLILDIFAKRAISREGKLQVELAQLNYRLPRLIGMGVEMSRLGGGIGTKGPGEKKLETDKRHIRRRVNVIKEELNDISKRRGQLREGRKKNDMPVVALVGYTNVGKSTLLNKLCNADVLAENKLFATLDTTSRLLILPNGKEVMLIDTVGFIRNLPHQLIDAFKSTLEETVFADALIHVVDASSEEAPHQMKVVTEILENLGALNKPVITALNKIDLVTQEKKTVISKDDKTYEISATSGLGLDILLQGVAETIVPQETEVSLLVPYDKGWVIPYIHENGRVVESDYVENGTVIKAVVKNSRLSRLEEFKQ